MNLNKSSFYRPILILICFLFVSRLEAGTINVLNTTGSVSHVGVLVKQENGTIDLVVGSPLLGHFWLLEDYKKSFGKVIKILWAGELEEINGKVTRVNESAGVIKTSRYFTLANGLDVVGTGINNLKNFLKAHKDIEEKYFTNTDYLNYSESNEHLNEYLKEASYLRHDIGEDFKVNDYLSFFEDPDPSIKASQRSEAFLNATTTAKSLLDHYNSIVRLFNEFDIPEWQQFKSYLEPLATEQNRNYTADDFDAVYSKFRIRYSEIFSDNKYKEITIVSRLTLEVPAEMTDLDRMMKVLKNDAKDGVPLVQTIKNNIELFTEENILKLIYKAGDVESKDEETVLVSMAGSIIEVAKDSDSGLTFSHHLTQEFLYTKDHFIGKGIKDYALFSNRMMRCFRTNELDHVLDALVAQKGQLITQDQIDFFIGTSFRHYKDGFFNQTGYDNRTQDYVKDEKNGGLVDHINNRDLFLIINFLIIGSNPEIEINGKSVPLIDHLIQHGRSDYFIKLDKLDRTAIEKRIKGELLSDIKEKINIGIEKAREGVGEVK